LRNIFESTSSINVTVISSPKVGLDYILELNDKCGISTVSKDILGRDTDNNLIIIEFAKEFSRFDLNTLFVFDTSTNSPRNINDISFIYATGNLPNNFYLLNASYVLILYVLTLFIILIDIQITTLFI